MRFVTFEVKQSLDIRQPSLIPSLINVIFSSFTTPDSVEHKESEYAYSGPLLIPRVQIDIAFNS
jgi:hypothetical protein